MIIYNKYHLSWFRGIVCTGTGCHGKLSCHLEIQIIYTYIVLFIIKVVRG